ncbi:unnamed protein product [Rhizophagus irregularis]|nr:unnamed protein product [Rhizophagus irregularis]
MLDVSKGSGSKRPIGEREVRAEESASKKKRILFERQERNLSFGSANSDMIQDRHGWALDGLIEKEANMNKEIINPSVEPEEVKIVVSQERPAIT